MKIPHRFVFASTVAVSLLLGACSSTPVAVPPTAAAVTPSAPIATPSKNAPAATSAAPVVNSPIAPYLDPKSALYQERSVYFDFDQSVVKPAHTKLLALHGKFLAAHPEIAIKIEGNTDEQGGAEYNLALGQKRAEAVRQALVINGAKATQMEAVSWGEEKPKSSGHDEAAHAQNRRADLVYPTK